MTYACRKRSVTCETCNQREAEFIVTNCPLHVRDHTKLCETCFYSFHYIDRKTKTCEFNAYRIKCNTHLEGSTSNNNEFELIGEYEVQDVELIDVEVESLSNRLLFKNDSNNG
jgi:protein-arginine kinase activator protein McsA